MLLLMLQRKAMMHRQCAKDRIFIGGQEMLNVGFVVGIAGHTGNIPAIAFERLWKDGQMSDGF